MTNEQKERANAIFDKLIDQKPYLADHINGQRIGDIAEICLRTCKTGAKNNHNALVKCLNF